MRRGLREQPDLIRNAVEEMLRFDPPVTQSGRIAVEPTSVGGCPVHAGSSISPMLLAANHDPAANPNPHHFDITREDIRHDDPVVAVTGLGAPLARLEAQIVVATLARRFPTLHLATDHLEYRTVPAFRGLVRLPVAV